MATAGWSVAEAGERVRAVGLTRSMPLLAEALAAGDVPLAHLHTLGRVWGNRRVRDRLGEFDELLTGFATTMTHRDFAVLAHRWEANADADGTRRDQRAVDEARDASIRPVGDEYVLAGNVAAAQGATMAEIFDAFTRAEFDADCAAAGAGNPLARTAAQRRADALFAIFRTAAGQGDGRGVEVTVNVTVDQRTFEDELARSCGVAPSAADPATWFTRRCETADGVRLDPAEMLAMACVGWVRRRVVDASGLTIDLGRRRRLFTGAALDALRLAGHHCVWAGCGNTTTQADHTAAFATGGTTDQANGALLCAHHNRCKERGYRIARDPTGVCHTLRPDGSEVGRPGSRPPGMTVSTASHDPDPDHELTRV